MLKKDRLLASLSVIFVLTEVALGILLQTSGRYSAEFSYAAIAVSALFCLLLFTNTANFYLTQLGLLFTLAADYFLVLVSPREQLYGMLCFSVTQICYFLRLYLSHGSKRARRAHLTVRCIAVLAALALTVLVLGEGADVLSLVSLFYYSNLILNLAVAVLQIRRSPLFPSALLLFLLCDTVIGLQVMADSYIPSFTGSALYPLLYPDFNLAWAFYLPSQALIPLSLLTERKVAKSSGGTSSKTEVAELRLVKVV